MFDLDGYIYDVREKISKIPNFDKDSVESLLELLPHLDENEKRATIDDINSIVDSEYTSHILRSKNPVLSFPSEEEAKGDGIVAGQVCAGDQVLYPFEFTRVNLTENIFGVGRAGSGKTTFIIYFINQLEYHKIRYTVIDWKNDYAFLAKMHPDVSLLKYNQIAYNPWTNIPHGMDRRLWWFIVLDVIAHSTGLYVATPSHVLEALEEIYQAKNGRINSKDLYQYLKSQNESKRREEYNSTALNRLFLLNELLDDVINVDFGFDLEDLFKQKCVIQMAPLHEAVSSFLFNILALWEYYRRLHKNIRADWKSAPVSYFLENFHMFIMDEAHLTQYGGHEHKDITIFSPPPLSIFFSQSREMGLATCAFTQFPNLVMSAFKTNAGTKIIGNVVESDIREQLADSLGLERDEQKILGKLDKGMWIVNVAGRTKKPFLMKTPMVEKPIIAEAELFATSKPLLTKLRMKRQEIESKMFLNGVQKQDPDKIHLPELPEDAWKVLQFVFDREFSYQKQIAEGIGLSSHKLDDMKKLLLAKNLIRIETFKVFTHNRTHYVLTPKTLDIFKTLGKSPQRIAYWRFLSTNPGYFHRYFQFLFLGMHRKLGWKGSVERNLPNGRRVDIYVHRDEDGKRKVIEIETTTTDLINKVRVIQDGYCDELVLLYKDMSGVQLARSRLEKMDDVPGDRVWIGLINDYVELIAGIIKARENAGNEPKQGTSEHGTDGNGKSSGNGVESD
ncbi:MAG: hypothetical protein ABI337_08225 [Nitrososphaera sp.]|jgi:hypothetical protein